MKPTKEKLEDLYFTHKVSPEKIAVSYKVSGRTIRNWMKDYGIPRLGASYLRKGESATWNIGLVRTDEAREKNRQAHLGRIPHNKGVGDLSFVCEVCGAPVVDKPYKRKRTCSKKCTYQLSHIHRGEDHWNFKGGDAGFRQRQRNWSAYREWRSEVLLRSDYTCSKCLKRGGKLTAHHLYTWNNNPKHRFDPHNGACVCWKCHWAFHRAFGHHNTNPDMFQQWLTTN